MEEVYVTHAIETLYASARYRCGGDATVRRAVEVARVSHAPHRRDGGETYIIHPIRVATHFLMFAPDPVTQDDVAAAVLHDVLEDDPNTSFEGLAAQFGPDVANAVKALSKKFATGGELSIPDFHRQLLASTKAVRIIKLCDRLDNLISLHSCPDEEKIANYLAKTARFYGELAMGTHEPLMQVILEEIEGMRRKLASGSAPQ
ncbi:MAG: HD domain-containing protein [Candidatus Sumerlaeaceae bacterium]|nr:HD domain-containing protein [Candidatus Sumerlaeaceae bacterium]